MYYILNHQFNNRGPPNTSVLLEDNSKLTAYPSSPISFPIKIHIKNIIPFQREAFEIIRDKFELIEDLTAIYGDYEIVSIYGETQLKTGTSDNRHIIFPFLRNLFLETMKFDIISGKRIFITRKHSESQHGGVLKRYILNEKELITTLNKYNFEFIQLEDLNMYDKIKLFMQSEIIVSSHSSALTLTLFANKDVKIIELLNKGEGKNHSQIIEISQTLGLKYNRYTNIREDANGNFNLNVNEFEKYLTNLL